MLFHSSSVLLIGFVRNSAHIISRSQKAGKSSMKSASRHVPQSSGDATHPADMDSCMIVNDETLLADQSTTSTLAQSLHAAAKPSAPRSTVAASSKAPSENADASAAKSTSRLFDLVNADSPVAQVSS